MSVAVVWTTMCDRCGWWDDRTTSNESRVDALRKAKAAGWSITQRRHLCNACKGGQS